MGFKKKKKYISQDEALLKLQKYCVYQDRCHSEVTSKLFDLGIYGEAQDEIIYDLITENFLNEERFARSYARGKFRFKKWGRFKIRQNLKLKKVSAYCIKKAMEEIDEEEYYGTLYKMLEKKTREYKAPNFFLKKQKAGKFAITKGYESALVWDIIREFEEKDFE